MIKRSSQNDRRILSFPAVHPCEAVSPAVLIASLINLSHNICNYQSKFFATQRKNTREAIREIGILLIFFEEIRDSRLILSNSVVLCLSEIHLAFQKLQFLMEDCTREGAKLWMLMKSEFAATQFRVLSRAIATALDVFPLDLIDISGEVKELVELVANQARKSKFELEKDDERAMKRVVLVLNDYFEKGLEPELVFIKQVLDYLEIKSWSDCQQEIRFLEELIAIQFSDFEAKEVPLLSSLLGFMNYCRAVIFKVLDYHHINDQADMRCNTDILACINPEDFRCPISLELMTDPVTVSTGQTYDRASIQKWLKAGNMICPKTGEKLANAELVPNTSLKRLIQQFCADHGFSMVKSSRQNRDIARAIVPASPAAAQAMKFVSNFLSERLCFGNIEEKNKAAYEIRLLAKSNVFNRSCLIEAGTVPPLLGLLSLSDHCIQENAMAALLKLSKHTNGKKVMIRSGGLQPILRVLNSGSSLESRQIAAATLFYLSSVNGYRKLIGETPEAITGLVDLISIGTACGKKNAIVAIFGLILHPENHRRAIDAGIVPLIVDVLTSSAHKDELKSDSLAVLAKLAEQIDGTFTIMQSSALDIIVGLLQSLNSRGGKEHCVSILLSLCSNGGEEVIARLIKDSSLMSSLYSLITDGTTLASKKARSLIKILQQFVETKSSSELPRSAARHERQIHAW